jgi:hypothetical protein
MAATKPAGTDKPSQPSSGWGWFFALYLVGFIGLLGLAWLTKALFSWLY